jgi:hypothetical protein
LYKEDKIIIVWTKAFFSDYIEYSVRLAIVFGPEEYKSKREINSASILLAM